MGYFSNGEEGMDYGARWCARCVHDGTSERGCAVLDLHLLHNHDRDRPNVAEMLDALIPRAPDGSNEQCRMFAEDTRAPVSTDQQRLDL